MWHVLHRLGTMIDQDFRQQLFKVLSRQNWNRSLVHVNPTGSEYVHHGAMHACNFVYCKSETTIRYWYLHCIRKKHLQACLVASNQHDSMLAGIVFVTPWNFHNLHPLSSRHRISDDGEEAILG